MKNALTPERLQQAIATLQERLLKLQTEETDAFVAKDNAAIASRMSVQKGLSALGLCFKGVANGVLGFVLYKIKEQTSFSLGEAFETVCIHTSVRQMEYVVRDLLRYGHIPQRLAEKLIPDDLVFDGMRDYLEGRGASHLAGLISERLKLLAPVAAQADIGLRLVDNSSNLRL